MKPATTPRRTVTPVLPQSIKTERLHLRPWRVTDAPLLKSAIDDNLDHLRPWMSWAKKEPSTLETIKQRLDLFDRRFRSGSEWLYAIYSGNESALYGGAGIHPIERGAMAIGFWLRKNWTRQGIATEAVRALTETALAIPGIERVQIRCDPRNTSSAAVAKRAGYQHVKTLPKETVDPEGRPRDTMIWELSRGVATPAMEQVKKPGRAWIKWMLLLAIVAAVLAIIVVYRYINTGAG